mgnify:CR=1 FL=1
MLERKIGGKLLRNAKAKIEDKNYAVPEALDLLQKVKFAKLMIRKFQLLALQKARE